jgi:hypothetical protein
MIVFGNGGDAAKGSFKVAVVREDRLPRLPRRLAELQGLHVQNVG